MEGRLHEGYPRNGQMFQPKRGVPSVLGEGHVLLYCPHLRIVHESGFAQGAFALAGFLLQDVAFALLAAQNLARAGHLETLSNSLTCLVDTTFAGHGGAIIRPPFYLASKIFGRT